jgi:hypothetical protein
VDKLLLQCTVYDNFLDCYLEVSHRRHILSYCFTTNNFQTVLRLVNGLSQNQVSQAYTQRLTNYGYQTDAK